jgi:hypothetical protein
MVLLEEFQSLKMIFASMIPPMLSGKRMQEEQSTALMRDCDAAKSDAAKKVVRIFQEKKKQP